MKLQYITRKSINQAKKISEKYKIEVDKVIENDTFLSLKIDNGTEDVGKPLRVDFSGILYYSYLSNSERHILFDNIIELNEKINYYLSRYVFDGTNENMKNYIASKIYNGSCLRMEYTSYSDSGGQYVYLPVDGYIENEGKTTVRTICKISYDDQYSENEHINAFCFNREAYRTFAINQGRISWVEELNINDDESEDDLPF
jgi:hypothetical protein